MTRYWKIGDETLGTSFDEVDLTELEPLAVELSEAEYATAQEDMAAAAIAAEIPPTPPISTALIGNNQEHITDATARLVTIHVNEPTGGPKRARPTVNGDPVVGGGGALIYQKPGSLTVKTNAGNNDLLILEEF